MKAKKIMALVLACTMMISQKVWAQEVEEDLNNQESLQENSEEDIESDDNNIDTQELTICENYPILVDPYYGTYGDSNSVYVVESADENICTATAGICEIDGCRNLYFTVTGINEGTTTVDMKMVSTYDDVVLEDILRRYEITVNPLPEDAVMFNDLTLRSMLIQDWDGNDDGCINLSEMKTMGGIWLVPNTDVFKSNSIKDLSGLEYAENLDSIVLKGNKDLENIDILFELLSKSLKKIDLRETNVSDEDRWKLADFKDCDLLKGDEITFPSLGNIFEDDFSIDIIDGEECVDVVRSDNTYSIKVLEGGEVNLNTSYHDVSKEITLSIQGIPANQELGDQYDIEVTRIDNSAENSTYPDKNLILDSNNQLWQIYPAGEKLRNNVKEYVSEWVYFGETKEESEDFTYILDTNNVLWNGSTKLADDVVKYDGRYALDNKGILTNIYNSGSEKIEQVEDWSSPGYYGRKGIAYLLKKDGSLWKRQEVKATQELQEWELVANDVRQITSYKYVKKDGSVINYDGTESNIEAKVYKLCDDGSFYDLDGNYNYNYYGEYINVGKVNIKNAFNISNIIYLLTEDNEVYKHKVGTEENSLYMTNVIQMHKTAFYDGADETTWAFLLEDGTYCDSEGNPMSEVVISDIVYCECQLIRHEDGSQAIERNGVAILNNVINIWKDNYNGKTICFALRTDGTVWDITTVGVPVKVLDLSQSGSSSEELDIKDCEITLSDTNYIYDGTAKEPSVAVKHGETLLTQDVDYIVSYENNIDPGTATVTVTGIGDYTGSITLEFTIQEKTEVENPFVDVSKTEYYYDPVLWAYENGIVSGIDETHFQPEKNCTRAQAVTFLWRAMGEPEPESASNPFTDIKSTEYYYKAVLWAYQNGIAAGVTETTFRPDTIVTRAQVITFLWRAEGQPNVTIENPFTDVKSNEYYYDAVLWAYKNGITSGATETLFKPTASCTRAQVVTFLYRDMQ